MRPVTNQPPCLFATAKTNMFITTEEINVDHLKLQYINSSKVIAKCLNPLPRNEFTISDTLTFPHLIKNSTNPDEYEDVSYGIESITISIPVEETVVI